MLSNMMYLSSLHLLTLMAERNGKWKPECRLHWTTSHSSDKNQYSLITTKPGPEPAAIFGYVNDEIWAKPPGRWERNQEPKKKFLGMNATCWIRRPKETSCRESSTFDFQKFGILQIWAGAMFCCIVWLWMTISQLIYLTFSLQSIYVCSGDGLSWFIIGSLSTRACTWVHEIYLMLSDHLIYPLCATVVPILIYPLGHICFPWIPLDVRQPPQIWPEARSRPLAMLEKHGKWGGNEPQNIPNC